jgi:phage-related protein
LRYISYNDYRRGILMAFEIEFYSSEDGREPVAEFLDSLDSKMSAKLVGLMEILEEKGTELRMPYSEHLEDGIFQLRCKQGSNITRVMYFFYVGKKIVATNGFVKKTQKTPAKELKLAKERRADWLSRHKEG